MKLSKKIVRFVACCAVGSLACVSTARAGTLATLIQNSSGPTTAVFMYNVTVGATAYPSGPGNTVPSLVGQSFTITGMQIYPDTNTIIVDQHDNFDEGTFSMNIDQANPANDFLVEQIDFGTGVGSPTGLETVYNSTKFLGFGALAGFPGEYWFGFQQDGVGSSLSPANGIIGGILQLNADFKIFAVSAPTPSAALGGMSLIVGLAGWRAARRFASKSA